MTATTSRRTFLKSSAGSALVIGFALPLSAGLLAKQAVAAAAPGQNSNSFAPNAWLRIAPDNRITIICGSAEMG